MSREQSAYVEKLQARINLIQADIDKLSAKAQASEADAKIALEQTMSKVVEKRDTAKARLKEIESSGAGAWEDLQSGAERAWKDLSQAVENAKSHFA